MLTVRMSQALYGATKAEIEKWGYRETIWFYLVKCVRSGRNTVYVVCLALFLGRDEAVRRRRRVKPSGLFQRWLYTHMMKEGFGDGLRVVTGHSHPLEHEAGFSGIDDRCMKDDQEIYRQAYGPYEFLWTVFSEKAESFEGRVIRPDGFRNVDRLVVVGEELLVFQGGKR